MKIYTGMLLLLFFTGFLPAMERGILIQYEEPLEEVPLNLEWRIPGITMRPHFNPDKKIIELFTTSRLGVIKESFYFKENLKNVSFLKGALLGDTYWIVAICQENVPVPNDSVLVWKHPHMGQMQEFRNNDPEGSYVTASLFKTKFTTDETPVKEGLVLDVLKKIGTTKYEETRFFIRPDSFTVEADILNASYHRVESQGAQ